MDGSISGNRGLGLIELLVAMTLGLTMAMGVIQIYTGNSQVARELGARIRIQENGRLALHFLVQTLRATAYPSCAEEQWLPLIVAGSSELPEGNIRGWEAVGTGHGDIQSNDSHVAVVGSNLGGWLPSAGEEMERFSLLSGSDVLQINDICTLDAASAMQGTLFYVGKRGNAAESPPGLFRRSMSGDTSRAEELFEGVASLQVLYGLERSGDMVSGSTALRYVVANEVVEWKQVKSLRISLLLQSVEDDLLAAPQPYTFHGVRYDGTAGNGPLPSDRRLRRVFATTLAWRTRISEAGVVDTQSLTPASLE